MKQDASTTFRCGCKRDGTHFCAPHAQLRELMKAARDKEAAVGPPVAPQEEEKQ